MKKALSIIFFLSLLLFTASSSLAQLVSPDALGQMENNANTIKTTSGFGGSTIGSVIATVIQAALGLLALIFIVLMIVAGFQWMTASGNEAQVKKSLDTIKTAIIGLVIVLAAYTITYFIFKVIPFGSNTPQGGTSGI